MLTLDERIQVNSVIKILAAVGELETVYIQYSQTVLMIVMDILSGQTTPTHSFLVNHIVLTVVDAMASQ